MTHEEALMTMASDHIDELREGMTKAREALALAATEIERLRSALQLIASGIYTEKGAEEWAKFVLHETLPQDPNGFERREPL